MSERYDVIIVGSGAGGGALAHTLAPSGKRILLLERGDFLPREMENWDVAEVFERNRYVSNETWYDADDRPFQPQVHYFVGGATKLYGAALYRMRPQDLGEMRHVDGVSPAWPLGYDELEPYYTKAEWLYQVRGVQRGGPHRGRMEQAVPSPPSPTSPGCSGSMTTSRPRAISRSTRPAASCSMRPTAPGAPAYAARGATATPAWCTRRRTPRR